MSVIRVSTDEEILATRDVMLELRPQVPAEEYLSRVRRMMQTDGFHLAAVVEGGTVRAVAGYRFFDLLFCGKTLYVDDLSTSERYRSQGHGRALVDWLRSEAKAEGCAQLHLDSGVQRKRAHAFYFREGLAIEAYHFTEKLR